MALTIKIEKVVGDIFHVKLNGKDYQYRAKDMSTDMLIKKFLSIAKYSQGKAYAYLKKHSEHVKQEKSYTITD